MTILRIPAYHSASIVGFVLLSLNLSGTIWESNLPQKPGEWNTRSVPGYSFAVSSRGELREVLEQARRGEDVELANAVRLVFSSLQHSDTRRIRIHENWLLWSLGRFYEPCGRTQNTQRLIAGGIVNCSESCQVLKTIAESLGHPCRFIGLNGHVMLEIKTPRGWRVADPDYGVMYPFDLATLQSFVGIQFASHVLQRSGFPPPAIETYLGCLRSNDDNCVLPVGSALSPRLWFVEVAADSIVWFIPLGMLLYGAAGSAVQHCQRRRTQQATQPSETKVAMAASNHLAILATRGDQ